MSAHPRPEAPASVRDERTTYHRLVGIKKRIPNWLLRRIDPYNSEADRFIAGVAEGLPEGAIVLDAGAGECRHAHLFGHTHYLGTDNQIGDAVAYDYRRLSMVSDLSKLPLRDACLDAVINVNVMEHTTEPLLALEEFHRTLKPGGGLYVVVPQSWRLHQAPQDYLRFTRYGMAHLLTKAGFEQQVIKPIGGAFWNLGLRILYLLTHFRGKAFPLAMLFAPLLGLVIPLMCFYLDRIDPQKEDTLGHSVVARRPER